MLIDQTLNMGTCHVKVDVRSRIKELPIQSNILFCKHVTWPSSRCIRPLLIDGHQTLRQCLDANDLIARFVFVLPVFQPSIIEQSRGGKHFFNVPVNLLRSMKLCGSNAALPVSSFDNTVLTIRRGRSDDPYHNPSFQMVWVG